MPSESESESASPAFFLTRKPPAESESESEDSSSPSLPSAEDAVPGWAFHGPGGGGCLGADSGTPNEITAGHLELGTGGWDPKRRTSYARIWRMVDIDPESTRREGAVLDARRFERLVEMVDRYYDVQTPTATAGSSDGHDWDY